MKLEQNCVDNKIDHFKFGFPLGLTCSYYCDECKRYEEKCKDEKIIPSEFNKIFIKHFWDILA